MQDEWRIRALAQEEARRVISDRLSEFQSTLSDLDNRVGALETAYTNLATLFFELEQKLKFLEWIS